MPNGGDNSELWTVLNEVRVELAALSSTVQSLVEHQQQRQSSLPTWVWGAVTALIMVVIWLANLAIQNVP